MTGAIAHCLSSSKFLEAPEPQGPCTGHSSAWKTFLSLSILSSKTFIVIFFSVTDSNYIDLASVKLSAQARVALNSQRSSWLCSPSAGFKGLCHLDWLIL